MTALSSSALTEMQEAGDDDEAARYVFFGQAALIRNLIDMCTKTEKGDVGGCDVSNVSRILLPFGGLSQGSFLGSFKPQLLEMS
jgi:hypothetical protein